MTTTNANAMPTLDDLLAASRTFERTVRPFPTRTNLISSLSPNQQAAVPHHARGTRLLVPHDAVPLLESHLERTKSTSTSPAEQAVYSSLSTWKDLARRLVRARPLTFYTARDSTLTRSAKKLAGTTKWQALDPPARPAAIALGADYLTYPEMALGALLAVSSPTWFMNDGRRYNAAEVGEPGTFTEYGILVGVVGPRLKVPSEMEARAMVGTVTDPPPRHALAPEWVEYYDEAVSDELVQLPTSPKYPKGTVLHVGYYRRRLRTTFDLLLAEAQMRASEDPDRPRAYLRVVGLGLGVWALNSAVQGPHFVAELMDAITASTMTAVAVVDLAWFSDLSQEDVPATVTAAAGVTVQILVSTHATAAPVPAGHLLIATYAWDSNSFPGNEYWLGKLTTSGDPAAVCCSTIGELQNPLVNPAFLDNIVVLGGE
ncbi:hypothetical protein GGF31_005111 [Allomyces arbusculus]|nr:hypothetical protein GGF31_005111 [Allomyces arbusculus]